MIHQRTHPEYVEGCGPCRWSSVRLRNWTTSPAQQQQFLNLWKDEVEIQRTKKLAAQGIVPRGTTTPALDEAEHMSRVLDKPWNAAEPESPQVVA